MKLYKFTVVFTPDKETKGAWNVTVPALPEVATFGYSVPEARYMAQDALELVILSRLEEGEAIPANKKPTRLAKGAVTDDILVTVSHEVRSAPVTPDVKAAFT